jgi:hypothetical protein
MGWKSHWNKKIMSVASREKDEVLITGTDQFVLIKLTMIMIMIKYEVRSFYRSKDLCCDLQGFDIV